MSSANLVSVILIPEAEYGVTPDLSSATATRVRYTSEGLSGTPEVTESTEIRSDRLSSGQVVVGSTIGGDLATELSKDDAHDMLIESAMMQNWNVGTVTAMTVSVVQDAGQMNQYTITGDGDFTAMGLMAGAIIQLRGFVAPDTIFNDVFKIQSVTDATNLVAHGRANMGDSTADGTHFVEPDYVDIGTDVISFTAAKAYTDVISTNPAYKGQSYPGTLVSAMAVSASYGEIMSQTYTTVANGYALDDPSLEQRLVTAGGSIDPAGTSNPLNATVDSGLVTIDGQATTFCISSIEVTLENNLEPQNCIGTITPKKYNAGKAAISLTVSIYNSEPAYTAFMPTKWTQTPIGLTFSANNQSGGYVFDMPAVQLTMEDPASTGENTQVMLDATGVAKVGASGESSLRIYQISPT